ncbi:MAG: hypothetical protein WD557_11175 [Dehalococcoidia bacterium]
MKTIELQDETWGRLQQHAIPLQDNADDVINRLLDLADGPPAYAGDAPTSVNGAAPAESPVARMPVPLRAPSDRREHTDVVLRRAGTVTPGARIAVLLEKVPHGRDPDENIFLARFAADGKRVVWDFDGKTYSISYLSQVLARRYGVRANAPGENGFRVFGLASDRTRSLEELRKRIEGRL